MRAGTRGGPPLHPRRRRRGLLRTPLLANRQPGGAYLARDLHYAGDLAAGLKVLLDGGYLHGDARASSVQTLAAELATAPGPDGTVVRPASSTMHPTGGVVVLKGKPCLGGAPSSRSPASDPWPSPAPACARCSA